MNLAIILSRKSCREGRDGAAWSCAYSCCVYSCCEFFAAELAKRFGVTEFTYRFGRKSWRVSLRHEHGIPASRNTEYQRRETCQERSSNWNGLAFGRCLLSRLGGRDRFRLGLWSRCFSLCGLARSFGSFANRLSDGLGSDVGFGGGFSRCFDGCLFSRCRLGDRRLGGFGGGHGFGWFGLFLAL